jgi:hypothetical protein
MRRVRRQPVWACAATLSTRHVRPPPPLVRCERNQARFFDPAAETEERSWRSYAVVMLFFSVAGFVTLYALQRVVFVQPVHDQHDRALVSAYQPASEQRATARPAARSSSPPAVRTR